MNQDESGLDVLSRQTIEVMERHAAAMHSRDVDIIAADYAEDTIVMTTLFPEPLIGKAMLKAAIAEAMKIPPITAEEDPVFHRKQAVGEYGYLVFENSGLTGTETYIVRDGKIVFESATITLKDM